MFFFVLPQIYHIYSCGKTCAVADQSTYNTIKKRIEETERGTLFFPDTFAYTSSLMALIVTALREIGEERVTVSQLTILKNHLKDVSEEDFRHDIYLAPPVGA